MKVVFIGTGSGKTSRKRFHSSILIVSNKRGMLIDAGDGVSKALLSSNVNTNTIDSILLSHYHADHFSGIALLITQMKLERRAKQLDVFTQKNLIVPLKNFLNYCYLFDENLGFKLQVREFKSGKKQNVNDSISFIPKRNTHVLRKEILEKYPAEFFVSSSFLLELGSKNIFYTSDIGSEEDLFIFKNHPVNYLISESTHVSPAQVLSAAKRMGISKIFLTHVGDEDEKKIISWHKKLSNADQKMVKICYDGLKFRLS